MKLQEWVNNKCKELVDSKIFKNATLKRIDKCQISASITSSIFEIGYTEPINMDIQIEEVNNRKELLEKIDALEVVFNVVKPRCRKPERYALFVKPI